MSKRIPYIDIINVVSCFSVVALHCNGYVHQLDHTDSYWWLHVLIEVLFYNAVPLFFMLSGATLIGYHQRYDTKTFFKKRIKKTFVPFLFLSFCFSMLYAYTRIGDDNILNILKVIILGLITGNVPFTTYWFFIPLFLIYLFMPFISIMVTNLNRQQQLSLIILLFVLQSCCGPILHLSNTVNTSIDFMHGLPLCNFVIYVLLGYFLSHNNYEYNNKLLSSLIIVSIILMVGRYILVYNLNTHDEVAFNYVSAYAVVPSATIFLVTKRYFGKTSGGGITFLAGKSFGVYLIQSFVISIMFRYIASNNIIALVMIPVIYVICIAAVWIVQQFKVTKWIMP